MKHLRLFETTTSFEAAKPTLEEPWVALTEEDEKVNYGGGGEPTPTYEFVDLGLPSGLKWAKCNIGAETETDYGRYFQYGDVEGRTAYEIAYKPCDWVHTPFNNGSSSYDSSYFTAHKSEWLDENDRLKPEYDAAHVNMGGDWRMPTEADFDELLGNTNKEWVTDYNGSGINGRLFTSNTNGNTLFIPAAGLGYGSSMGNVGTLGNVWSSSLNTSNPRYGRYLVFNSGNRYVYDSDRFGGFSVRGVRS